MNISLWDVTKSKILLQGYIRKIDQYHIIVEIYIKDLYDCSLPIKMF